MASQSSNYIQALTSRIRQEEQKLDQLQDDLTLTSSDFHQAEQSSQAAIDRARRNDQDERSACEHAIASYHRRLVQWKEDQAAFYRAEIDKHRSLANLLIVFLACFVSFGIYLAIELNEVRSLQSKRDNPPLDDEQRQWIKELENNQRQINYLRSLTVPRQTQEMRHLQNELTFLRGKRDRLDQQVRFKELEIEHLRRERDAALAGGTGQQNQQSSQRPARPSAGSGTPDPGSFSGWQSPQPRPRVATPPQMGSSPQSGTRRFVPPVTQAQPNVGANPTAADVWIEAEWVVLDEGA